MPGVHATTWREARKHMRVTEDWSRMASSTLFQMRSGDVQLGAHLHRIGCLTSPLCEKCGKADETVRHYLYNFPHWQEAWHRMREAVGDLWWDRAHLLSGKDGIAVVPEFTREPGWDQRGAREDEDGRPEDGIGEAKEEEGRDELDGQSEGEDDEGVQDGEDLVEVTFNL
ncbi:unnamed protein product [Peniophora sp. CBMAI 1063]|nr:unnamed protein product [Peniophora sp. CBMAI 1063]